MVQVDGKGLMDVGGFYGIRVRVGSQHGFNK